MCSANNFNPMRFSIDVYKSISLHASGLPAVLGLTSLFRFFVIKRLCVIFRTVFQANLLLSTQRLKVTQIKCSKTSSALHEITQSKLQYLIHYFLMQSWFLTSIEICRNNVNLMSLTITQVDFNHIECRNEWKLSRADHLSDKNAICHNFVWPDDYPFVLNHMLQHFSSAEIFNDLVSLPFHN